MPMAASGSKAAVALVPRHVFSVPDAPILFLGDAMREEEPDELGLPMRVGLLERALEECAHRREAHAELLRDVCKPIGIEESFRGSRLRFRQPVKLAQMASRCCDA